jgi:RNase P/RNase MRP subunit POP5
MVCRRSVVSSLIDVKDVSGRTKSVSYQTVNGDVKRATMRTSLVHSRGLERRTRQGIVRRRRNRRRQVRAKRRVCRVRD